MPSLKIPLEVGAVVECRVRAMPISDAEHDRALATILGADGLYLADEVRDVAAVLASHLIERFEAAYRMFEGGEVVL